MQGFGYRAVLDNPIALCLLAGFDHNNEFCMPVEVVAQAYPKQDVQETFFSLKKTGFVKGQKPYKLTKLGKRFKTNNYALLQEMKQQFESEDNENINLPQD